MEEASNLGKAVKESDSGNHPDTLLLPPILEVLFQVCSLEELKTFRLVCKTWFNVSLDRFRSSLTVRINQGPPGSAGNPHSLVDIIYGEATTVRELLDEMENPNSILKITEKPYQSVFLWHWDFKKKYERVEIYKRFWRTCGPSMKRIKLHDCVFYDDVNALANVMFRSTRNLEKLNFDCNGYRFRAKIIPNAPEQKNLKSLIINLNPDNDTTNFFPIPYVEFLKLYPNLEELRLEMIGPSQEMVGFLEAMKTIRDKDKTKLNLKHFDMEGACYGEPAKFPPEVGQLFEDLKLPLEFLKIDFGRTTSKTIIKQILQSHAGSLKTLQIFRFPARRYGRPPYQRFPFGVAFEFLTELKMWGPVVANLSFLKYMPNLKTLCVASSMAGHSDDDDLNTYEDRHRDSELAEDLVLATKDDPGMSTLVMLHLEKLEFDFKFSAASFIKLVKWMPNIKSLHMPVINEGFRAICELLPDLVELKLDVGTDIDDEAVTGTKKQLAKRDTRCETGSTSQETRPANITNLKCLQTFEMIGYSRRAPVKLTERSVVDGFLQLPRLKTLKLILSNKPTAETLAALWNKIPEAIVEEMTSANCASDVITIPAINFDPFGFPIFPTLP